MATTKLKATERDNTLNPRQLRKAGFLPATLYGVGVENASIQVREEEFVRLFGHGAREFELDGFSVNGPVRVAQMQLDPRTQKVLSLEFNLVSNVAKPGKNHTQELSRKDKKKIADAKAAEAAAATEAEAATV